MNFVFSKHSLEQMERRGIRKDTVENVLTKPEQTKTYNGKKVYQSVIKSEDKNYLIRVFVNTKTNPKLVITVYLTSKIKKYYES